MKDGRSLGKLTDPERLACYKNALANWRYEGYIVLTALSLEWLRRELKGVSSATFKRMLFEHVQAGGEIDEVAESRPEWLEFSHHYDLRLRILDRLVHVETRLIYRNPKNPDDPYIHVVSVHDV